jgi:hypothetical protein
MWPKIMNSYSSPKSHSPWCPREGRFSSTVSRVTISDEESVRLNFRLDECEGIDGAFFAGKTYKKSQHSTLELDLRTWLGNDQMDELFPDGFLDLDRLPQLKGRCAVIRIEHKDCGQKEPFCDVTGIWSCDSFVSEPEKAPRRGFMMKGREVAKWN